MRLDEAFFNQFAGFTAPDAAGMVFPENTRERIGGHTMDVIATVDRRDAPVLERVETYYAQGGSEIRERPVQRERDLEVYVNDALVMKLGCSDGSLVELVVGRLFTEGFIDSVDEIDCVSVCDSSMRAFVYLKDRTLSLVPSQPGFEKVPTCCTMNRTLVKPAGGKEPTLHRVPQKPWDPAWVFSVLRAFEGDSPMHRKTRGTHSCYVAREGEVLFVCEDIGRHNAFDKAVGRALTEGVDLSECMMFSSGRVPTDMAVKAIRAGVPLLATKASATDQAVELARRYDMVLVASANTRFMDVLNDPWRAAVRCAV